MAYRNGVYVAFHAGGTTDPTSSHSDIKYYNLMKAWQECDNVEFNFVNSHEKVSAVRDTSSKETLRRSLCTRLNNSKVMLLIMSSNTKKDNDWVPYEINYALNNCDIPIVVTYADVNDRIGPSEIEYLKSLWPEPLKKAIESNSESVRTIHIPFNKNAILDAINQFSCHKKPNGKCSYYSADAYKSFGL